MSYALLNQVSELTTQLGRLHNRMQVALGLPNTANEDQLFDAALRIRSEHSETVRANKEALKALDGYCECTRPPEMCRCAEDRCEKAIAILEGGAGK